MNEKEQLEFCEILDNWYYKCKSQFLGSHPLGMRKEDLKSLVCKWLETKKFVENNECDCGFFTGNNGDCICNKRYNKQQKFCECGQCLLCHIIDVNTCDVCKKPLRKCKCEEEQ